MAMKPRRLKQTQTTTSMQHHRNVTYRKNGKKKVRPMITHTMAYTGPAIEDRILKVWGEIISAEAEAERKRNQSLVLEATVIAAPEEPQNGN